MKPNSPRSPSDSRISRVGGRGVGWTNRKCAGAVSSGVRCDPIPASGFAISQRVPGRTAFQKRLLISRNVPTVLFVFLRLRCFHAHILTGGRLRCAKAGQRGKRCRGWAQVFAFCFLGFFFPPAPLDDIWLLMRPLITEPRRWKESRLCCLGDRKGKNHQGAASTSAASTHFHYVPPQAAPGVCRFAALIR